MGRQHVRKGKLALNRQKTGVPFEVPVMEALQSAIAAMPAGDQDLKTGHCQFQIRRENCDFTAS
jgi:hypothetical protein